MIRLVRLRALAHYHLIGCSGQPISGVYRDEHVVIGPANLVYAWVALVKEHCTAMALRESTTMPQRGSRKGGTCRAWFSEPAKKKLCRAEGDAVTDSKNPYIGASGEAELKASVVAFVDILGFKKLASSTGEGAPAHELLCRLRRALRESFEHIRYHEKSSNSRDPDLYRVRIFTDNIVIAHPIAQDGEMELGLLFNQLAIFQTLLATHGFFARGGVAIGEATIDEDIVFGPGLVKAYELESTKARDPRIVLSLEAEEAVKTHLEYYADQTDAPQTSEFLVDADGQLFINYLHAALLDDEPRVDIIQSHKQQVESQLSAMLNQPEIWSKYAWVASYHNFFCVQNQDQIPSNLKIDMTQFTLRPRLLA